MRKENKENKENKRILQRLWEDTFIEQTENWLAYWEPIWEKLGIKRANNGNENTS